jgi:hypothetical protein
MRQLNLKSRIQRLENRFRLLGRNETDDRLLRRIEAAEQRLARYQSTKTYECQNGGKKGSAQESDNLPERPALSERWPLASLRG